MRGTKTYILRFLLRSAKNPPSKLPGMPASRIAADSNPPVDGAKCRTLVTYSLNSCEVVKYAPYPPRSAMP